MGNTTSKRNNDRELEEGFKGKSTSELKIKTGRVEGAAGEREEVEGEEEEGS